MKTKPKHSESVTFYSETFKQLVIKEYERGLLSIDGLRNKYGIATSHEILSWIGQYTPQPVSFKQQQLRTIENQLVLKKHKLQYS
ncbi:hypothetical protein ABN763_09445 [Spongiivirga sp. MCCC 1A20706]|uniref:hypothetical protein n=1 Tax=Spongiivirga sp. MCCC 1A20706 TaxID=3160963 RepID=UPI003977599C